jgi:hypothetical protein
MLAAAGTALAADSPWAGKWKLDPAQSKLAGDTLHITSTGNDLVYTAAGHTTKYTLGGSPTKSWAGDETSWKKVYDNTYEAIPPSMAWTLEQLSGRSHRTARR